MKKILLIAIITTILIFISCVSKEISNKNKLPEIVYRFEQPNGYKFCAILVGDEDLHKYYLADCNMDYANQKRDTEIEIYKGEDNYWRYNEGIIIGGLPQEDACTSAPEQYKAACEMMDDWLDQKIFEWEPVVRKPLLFGIMNNAPMNNLSYEFSDEYERATEETGADFVRMDFPKLSDTKEAEAIAKLNKVVKSAQSRGKKVMIGNNVNGDKGYFGNRSLSWREYSEKQKEYLRAAANIGPDYIAVILEPVVVSDPKVNAYRYLNFSESVTPQMWIAMINETIDIIKDIDPNIKTAIGIIPQNTYDQQFFIGMLNSKIDIVGVDIYDRYGFGATDATLVPEWKAKGGTKEFWIMETWAGALEFEGSVDQEWKKRMDAKWIKAMTYYSQKNNLSGINPFFSKHFFAYDSETINDLTKLSNALKTQRTSTFYAYRNLITKFKRNR